MQNIPLPRPGSTVSKDSTTRLRARAELTSNAPTGIDSGRRTSLISAIVSSLARWCFSTRDRDSDKIGKSTVPAVVPDERHRLDSYAADRVLAAARAAAEAELIRRWIAEEQNMAADQAMCVLLCRELDEVLWKKRLSLYLEAIR